jgi:hypothetical protein
VQAGSRVRLVTLKSTDKWARDTFAHVLESQAVGTVTETREAGFPLAVQWPGISHPLWMKEDEVVEVTE